MWQLVFWLNLLGPKRFVKFFAAWVVIMLFFFYCLVPDAFDPHSPAWAKVQKIQRPVKQQAQNH